MAFACHGSARFLLTVTPYSRHCLLVLQSTGPCRLQACAWYAATSTNTHTHALESSVRPSRTMAGFQSESRSTCKHNRLQRKLRLSTLSSSQYMLFWAQMPIVYYHYQGVAVGRTKRLPPIRFNPAPPALVESRKTYTEWYFLAGQI